MKLSSNSVNQLFSNGKRNSNVNRLLQFPIVRIFIAILFLFPAILCFNMFYNIIEPKWTSYIGDFGAIIIISLYIGLYTLYLRIIEKRLPYELSKEKSVQEVVIGFLISATLVGMTVLFIIYFGSMNVISQNSYSYLLHAFFIFGLLAFAEDLIFRGIIFRMLEEILGTWISIVLVALAFGIVHLIHEEATLLSAVGIALADLILAGAFILTRRIWLCWGIHWGWNFTQDGIFGMPNSGVELLPSWLNTDVTGPLWITGGKIGIEFSVIGIILNIIVGVILIRIAMKRKQIVSPSWVKK